jgi:hypothetical protein
MRMRRFVTRLAAVGLIAGLAVLLGPGTSPAVAQETIVLTEVTTSFVPVDRAPAGPSVGDSFTFTANLVDPVTDQQVGTSSGKSVNIAVKDGRVTGFIRETLTLTTGKITAFGVYDQTALQSGTPQTITAIGLTGAFRGKFGTLTAAPVEQGVETLTICFG